jgi:hypothetical protein
LVSLIGDIGRGVNYDETRDRIENEIQEIYAGAWPKSDVAKFMEELRGAIKD